MNNILIPFQNAIDPNTGGVERVYHNLVPVLKKLGCQVFASFNLRTKYDLSSVYTEVYYLGDITSRKKYNEHLAWLIRKNNINIVICPFPSWQLFDFFSRQKEMKVFFHIHNVPSKIMYPEVSMMPSCLINTFVGKWVKKIRYAIRFKASFKRIEQNGMKVVLLSDKFKMDLASFCSIADMNILSIPNPIELDKNFELAHSRKDKILLYVGRITTKQKRFQSLLNIWGKIQYLLPDYRLDVVGGGPEKEFYENKAKEMHLERIAFHGFQSPEEYYKKAQVLCMVSNYEGFPMVLVEAMQYGCVPFAFKSFAAVTDIIDDKHNGFLVEPFNEDEYISCILKYINKTDIYKEVVRQECVNKVSSFSVDKIAREWIKMFNNY